MLDETNTRRNHYTIIQVVEVNGLLTCAKKRIVTNHATEYVTIRVIKQMARHELKKSTLQQSMIHAEINTSLVVPAVTVIAMP
jgi:hypothetical protein